MKRFRMINFVLAILCALLVFGISACNENPHEGGGGDGDTETTATYEITVDAAAVSVELSKISVCLYTTDGTLVKEKKLSGTVATFEVEKGRYIATLSGLAEDVSYSSVLLGDTRKVTIALKPSDVDAYNGTTSFTFTIFAILPEGMNLEDLFIQICDDNLCRSPNFDQNGVANVSLTCGEYQIKVENFEDGSKLYDENYTITLEKRYFVILL